MLAATDCETTGTDSFHGCRPFLFSACDGKNNYMWEGVVDQRTRNVKFDRKRLNDYRDFLYSTTTLIFQNTNFDMRMIEASGIDIAPLWPKIEDTLVASHLICSGDVHGLKPCAFKYVGYPMDDEEDLKQSIIDIRAQLPEELKAHQDHPHFPALKNQEWWAMDMWMDMPRCRKYAFGDAERTWLLWKVYRQGLIDDGTWDMYVFRRNMLKILYDMQSHGINIYTEKARRMVRHIQIEKKRIVDEMQRFIGNSMVMDPSKPDCLIHMLFKVAGLPVYKHTDTGKPSTDQDALDYLEEQHPEVKVVQLTRSWRKANKREDAITGYLLWEHEGRLHSTLNLTGTKWTRQSSAAPNQQNFEKTLSYLFGPPPGKYWLYMDVVNIELRIWAYEVGSKSLIEAFESGESVHMIIARVLYPELIERLGEKEFKNTSTYTNCKSGTFARLYGGGTNKVDNTYGVKGACAIIDKRLPEVGKYFKHLQKELRRHEKKYLYPTIFTRQGYKLEVPITKEYSVSSGRIQGSAGLVVQDMMQHLVVDPVYIQVGAVLITQVHDSLTLEISIHEGMETTNAYLVSLCEHVGRKHIPTCPMDPKVIMCSIDEEPKFHDYSFPHKLGVYESELYFQAGKWFCQADHPTLKYDRYITEGETKEEAVDNMYSLLHDKIASVVEVTLDENDVPF